MQGEVEVEVEEMVTSQPPLRSQTLQEPFIMGTGGAQREAQVQLPLFITIKAHHFGHLCIQQEKHSIKYQAKEDLRDKRGRSIFYGHMEPCTKYLCHYKTSPNLLSVSSDSPFHGTTRNTSRLTRVRSQCPCLLISNHRRRQ